MCVGLGGPSHIISLHPASYWLSLKGSTAETSASPPPPGVVSSPDDQTSYDTSPAGCNRQM
eukprot:4767807-Prymnesium_polylepis.1